MNLGRFAKLQIHYTDLINENIELKSGEKIMIKELVKEYRKDLTPRVYAVVYDYTYGSLKGHYCLEVLNKMVKDEFRKVL